MKNFEIELIYKALQKIPNNLPFELKLDIVRNKSIIESQHIMLDELRKICSEDEIKTYLMMEFDKCELLKFINISNLPDNMGEFDSEFVEGIFLLTT